MELFDNKKLTTIHNLLYRKQETIAVAESVTSGLLQLTLAQAEKAAEFFQGGICVYNLGQKCRHLAVEPIHAQAVDCVSEKVSQEMAINACRLFTSDWGIGITGYATPVPESGGKLFAFYAIARKGKIVYKSKITAREEEAFNIQLKYVTTILDQLLKQLR
jgi:PncC family amidohydrolase